jgi:hypothetical protein
MTEAENVMTLPVVQEQSPMAMIAMAVQSGMDPATIKALMDLRDRDEATQARKAFVTALNAFKADPPAIFKNKQVSFGGAGKTAYKHATLDNVSGAIGAGLAKVGISHRWETEQMEGGLIRVTCVLTHAMGHSERVPLQAMPDTSGSKNSIQAVGSTVTYLQRYTLLAATGMAVQDQDDDGRQGKGNLMADNVKADYMNAIEACRTMKEAEELWPDIAKAATAAGDVPSYEELKAAMVAKRKLLKGTA